MIHSLFAAAAVSTFALTTSAWASPVAYDIQADPSVLATCPGTAPSPTYFKPTVADTFLYDIETTAISVPSVKSNKGVVVNPSVYIVDLFSTPTEQIAKYKQAGKHVVCYFSAGSWESGRPDSKTFSPECYCGKGEKADANGVCKSDKNQLDGWDEWWLDLHNPTCLAQVQAIQKQRIALARSKGCDGIDPDNVDAYDNGNPHGITMGDSVSYVKWLASTAHSMGLASGLKNAAALVPSVVNDVDFSVTEQCVQYDECDSYFAFEQAGKPIWDVEYGSKLKKCPSNAPKRMMQYSKNALNLKWINLNCQA